VFCCWPDCCFAQSKFRLPIHRANQHCQNNELASEWSVFTSPEVAALGDWPRPVASWHDDARRCHGQSVRKVFPPEKLIHTWAYSSNTVYLIYPEGVKISEDRFGRWDSDVSRQIARQRKRSE
jgi:hypothetical protein